MHEKPPQNLDSDEIPNRLIYGSEEARILLGGMPEPTFRRLTGSKKLKVTKIGSRVYVEADELKAFIARQNTGEQQEAS
jgi:hypothetical protein